MGTTSPLLYVCGPTAGLVVPPPGGLTAIVSVRVAGMREKLAVTVLSESIVTDVLAELGLATAPDQLVN